MGGGKHQLVFNKLELKDAGAIMCKSNELTSICILEVKKGEEKPVIEFEENVEGPVSRPIIFEVPYKGDIPVSKLSKTNLILILFYFSEWYAAISY